MAAGKIRNAKETVNVVKKVIKHRSELVKAGSNASVVVGSKKVAKESINHIQEKRDKGSK